MDLPTIFNEINPLLKKHNLGFTQLIQGTQLETIIFHHPSGEYIKSLTDIPQGVQLKGMNDFQVAGSSITYFRRYALSSALGLVTDKDIDGGGKQEPKEEPTKEDPEMKIFNERFSKAKTALSKGLTTIEAIDNELDLTDKQVEELKMHLPILTDEEFEEQKEALEQNKTTLSNIKTKYVLSTIQEKALELIEGVNK